MADAKISQLTGATTPLDGTEVLPIVQNGTTKKVANNDLRPKQIQSNATSGVLQVAGPAAASTRVMTVPDANFTAARTDTGQTFNGDQIIQSASSSSTNATMLQFKKNVTASKAYITVLDTQTGDASAGIAVSRNGHDGRLFFVATNSSGVMTDYMYILGDSGDVWLASGNLIQGTAAKGINFTANTPAAGMTSQLLNWYEEGTWTPNQGAGLTVVGSFTSSGTYTRIGRTVVLRGTVSGSTSVAVSASGIISSNPPFTPATTGFGNLIDDSVAQSSVSIISSAGNIYSVSAITATPGIAFQIIYTV